MRIVIADSADRAADLVTGEILAALQAKPDLVLGLATGSTPIPVYRRLVAAHAAGEADLSRMRTFNLDEYVGLEAGHPQSYRAFMHEHLFRHLDLAPEYVQFPPTEGPDLPAQCRAFEERIRDLGGIDIQLLGIGRNGHIGFNEPTSSLRSRTRIVSLTDKTLADNRRFFGADEAQPTMAATMGIGTILNVRRVVLQAFGAAKAEAIRGSIEGPVTSFCPGSALQLHPDVAFFVDEEAAAELSMADYYRRAESDRRRLES